MSKTVMFVLKTTANRFSFHQECTEPPCGWKMNVSSQIAQKIFSLLNWYRGSEIVISAWEVHAVLFHIKYVNPCWHCQFCFHLVALYSSLVFIRHFVYIRDGLWSFTTSFQLCVINDSPWKYRQPGVWYLWTDWKRRTIMTYWACDHFGMIAKSGIMSNYWRLRRR